MTQNLTDLEWALNHLHENKINGLKHKIKENIHYILNDLEIAINMETPDIKIGNSRISQIRTVLDNL